MLEFNEEKHEYLLDGKKLISTTQLMQKHGLAPKYDNVDAEVLKRKAEYGTLVHKEIEEYIKENKIGFSEEVGIFKVYVENNNVNVLESEFMTNNDVVAGTIDLIYKKDNNFYIGDIKTTYTLHKEAVSWQLSIYTYLYWNSNDNNNELVQNNYQTTKGQAYHFNKNSLEVVDIPLKPYDEVEKLINCERQGILYKQELQGVDYDLMQLQSLEEIIKKCDEEKKQAEQKAKELKDAIIKAMEERQIKSFENDGIKLTYVAPSTRTTLDSKLVKEKYPEIYDECTKTSQTTASLRITLKNE